METDNVYKVSFFSNIIWMILGPTIVLIPVSIFMYQGINLEDLTDSNTISAVMVSQAISNVIPIVISVVLLRRLLLSELIDFKNNLKRSITIVLLGISGIYFANIILSIIYSLLNITGDSENQQIIETALSSPVRPVVIIMILVLAPILEELIFRKFLIGYFKSKQLNPWIPYIISIVVFAAIHMNFTIEDLIFFPAYLVLSAVITLAYKYSGNNIYVAILVHFLNNLLSLI